MGATLLFSGLAGAQDSGYEPNVLHDEVDMKENQVVAYPYLREADVKYRKRLHRIIDVRQKMNKVLSWPKNPFTKLIYESAINGKFSCYLNDSLVSIVTPEDILKMVTTTKTIQIHDYRFPDDDYALIDTQVVEVFDYTKIKKFRIMEDWFFDYKRSEFRPRIHAIAPIFQKALDNGSLLPESPMFWVRMNDFRPTMARQECFNRFNDAMRLSYDDFFNNLRMFDSYVVKESNVFDIDVPYFDEYKDNSLEALLKSEEIRNDLFIFEHDLWQY